MFLKFIVLGVLIISLTACIGYDVMSGYSGTCDRNCKGSWYSIGDKAGVSRVHGKPDHIIQKNGKEYWVYNKDIAFRGFILGLVVPVPLVIPVGFNKTIFEFENDTRINTTYSVTQTSAAHMCILPFGCYYVQP
jgi:hypothetical protein